MTLRLVVVVVGAAAVGVAALPFWIHGGGRVEAPRLVALAWISLRRLKHEGRCGRGGRGGGAYIEAAVLGTPGPHDDGKASGFLPAALPGSRGVGTLGWICQLPVRMRGMQRVGPGPDDH